MKLALSHSHLNDCLSDDSFIQAVDPKYLHACLKPLADYYDEHLLLWQVMHHYGVDEVSPEDDTAQVPCILPEHGTNDNHKSSRYYRFDRDTNAERGSVWCFKCEKLQTAFWFIYNQETGNYNKKMKEVFQFIFYKFGVRFPRDIILEFDPVGYYSFDSDEDVKSIRAAELVPLVKKLITEKESHPEYLKDVLQVVKGV